MPLAASSVRAQQATDTTRSADSLPAGNAAPRDSTAVSDSTRNDSTRRDSTRRDSTRRDSTRRDTTARDSAARRDTTARAGASPRADTAARRSDTPKPIPPPPDDTSLTARMDVRRGGGLTRSEFPDLLQSAQLTRQYGRFLRLVERSGWAQRLAGAGPYTLLAPNDLALRRVQAPVLARLEGDSVLLHRWVGDHVFAGSLRTADLLSAGQDTAESGRVVRFTRDSASGSLRADDARVVQPDLMARNGMMQGIDRALAPDTVTRVRPPEPRPARRR
ncbi:MAG TPA: fasciclin domain-containing protein [Gemmatimonadales bacterium]|nr:fasciclin domain-containing protein [Gemmatimonadales bacterium]